MTKRVGIMTFPHSPSFGASLQMRALYDAIVRTGNEPYIINYINDYMRDKKHISKQKKSLYQRTRNHLASYVSNIRFGCFENELRFYPSNTISTYDELIKLDSFFDCIVCGSDQVWNPKITGKDMAYFLNFASKAGRIAYAPSFGITELSNEEKIDIGRELKQFASLSVREKQGVALVDSSVGTRPVVVVDPTMLMPYEYWVRLERKPRGLSKHYIADFTFHPNNETIGFTTTLKNETGFICKKYSWSLRSIMDKSSISMLGPREWLWYIHHADYVVTDSFHGAVFSILFQREFYVSMTAQTNSRLIDLLDEFNLSERKITSRLQIGSIEYDSVGSILNRRVKESFTYLKDALNRGII